MIMPLEHLGGRRSSAEDASRESRRRGGGVRGGAVPLPGKFMNFSSLWCDMVHSGCVVFKIHVFHGL